jgi:hypothetical protein
VLHVVRMGYSSYGRGHTLHLSEAEFTISIHTKFWTNDYVGQTKRIAKFSVLLERLPMCVKYTVTDSPFFLLLLVLSTHLQTSIRNGFWRMMAENTWFGVRMSLLRVRSVTNDFRSSKSPKSAPVGKSQPKRKRPIMLNNFLNRQNMTIIVMNN